MIKTQRTKDLLQEIRMSDMYDGYGVCMAWMFSISDYLTFNTDSHPPAEWEYRPAMVGADTDSFEYQALVELNYSAEDLEQIIVILSRWYDLLIAANKNY
ncbi:MAG: hypothetical protein KUG64_10820 [Cycloclasticus sp.]|nr:hypothetical protein [Cycloclasticus sp.]